ncbi:hypothetical protein [Kitasatospora sp. NPDC093558]|uniref:hypothetical protein n=1 Tax=Kitasatospora sp. NPDC093558 TaxID=3155201 RepID=UPI00341472D3
MIRVLRRTPGGRCRSTDRDPIGSVIFTALWVLGHVLCLALLGTVVQHQLAASSHSHTTALDGVQPPTPHTA